MANSFLANVIEPVVTYTKENKPFHSKIAEVVTTLLYEESIDIEITDENTSTIVFIVDNALIPIFCDGVGYDSTPYESDPYDLGGTCPMVPEGVVFIEFDETFSFELGSELEFNDDTNIMFCNKNLSTYDSSVDTYNFFPSVGSTVVLESILVVDIGADSFTIAGDYTDRLNDGVFFEIQNSTANDKPLHNVLDIIQSSGSFDTVFIEGNHVNKFKLGFGFEIINSAANNGIYTTHSSIYNGVHTIIQIEEDFFSPLVNGHIITKWLIKDTEHDSILNRTKITVYEDIVDGTVDGDFVMPLLSIQDHLADIGAPVEQQYPSGGFGDCGYEQEITGISTITGVSFGESMCVTIVEIDEWSSTFGWDEEGWDANDNIIVAGTSV